MSSETFSSLQLGIAVDLEDVYRVLSYKPGVPKDEVADVVLKGKVVKQIMVPIHDEGTQPSWTVREVVHSEFDEALSAFCKPLKLGWGYAPYSGEIPCVWFSPLYKEKDGCLSFREMARVIKDMPRVRKIIKRVLFGTKKLNEGVFAAIARD